MLSQHFPVVSIIVPNYNHERYLVQRLESIFNQTFQDFEVILLDDCSTDGSVSVLQRYASHPKVTHFIINEKNSGSPFVQWKRGIDLARGQYIWIAESDDWADLDFLAHLLPLVSQPNVNIAFCNSHWVNQAGAIQTSLSLYNTSFQRLGTEEIKTRLFISKYYSKCECGFVSSGSVKGLFG
ncbi:MAG: glycosyltransferase family 2 protein [Saprospiraceae bacterium]|nr:glycosyltransferase family 2 protein [Saprospiraceae bacterium]